MRPLRTSYPLIEGIPCLLSSGENRQRIREVYDEIYRHHTDVWVDQGRSGPFQNYFSDLVRAVAYDRLLEVGCGEGALLAAYLGLTGMASIRPSMPSSEPGAGPTLSAPWRALKSCPFLLAPLTSWLVSE